VKEAIKAVNEEEERSRNVIIYGVKEEENEDGVGAGDIIEINSLLGQITMISKQIECSDIYVRNMYRIGKKTTGKVRIYQSRMGDFITSARFMSNAHKLKASDD
jgi:hypothetical protein